MAIDSSCSHQLPDFSQKVSEDRALIEISTAVYHLVAIFRTCYTFTGRSFLFLAPAGPERIRVYLKAKNKNINLTDVTGDFCNELINQQVRYDLAQETAVVRQLIVAQAFAEGNLLDERITTGDTTDDPFGITKAE